MLSIKHIWAFKADDNMQVYYECSRKVKFWSETQAYRANHNLEKPMNVYKCTHCNGWHLGHSKKKEVT